MKNILLIGTGGTIACKRSESGLKPVITSEEIISYVPEVKSFCNIDSVQVMNIDSTNIQPNHWLKIVETIRTNYNKYDGFVICHGTDTMAYTASALSYLIQNSKKPIVITGAQKPIDMENTDARINLHDSLMFAASDKSNNVSIVFDGKVIAGTRGKKVRSKSYNAFSSINFPYIATIQEDTIIYYINEVIEGDAIFSEGIDSKVALLKLIPSCDASLLDYMAEHYDAVIIESFGVGGLPTYDSCDYYRAISKWTALGKIVVMATQVTNEGSNMTVYEVGRNIKKEFGLLETYDMTLESAVTKMMWILGKTKDQKEIKNMFYKTINKDILWKQQ